MELNLEEQTLVASFRRLDQLGKKELLRYLSLQHKDQAEMAGGDETRESGQCPLEREEERPEAAAEPIFTE